MYECCKPGETVLRSGIYRVRHGSGCAAEHDVTCVFGNVFPRCNHCGDKPNFSLVRYAADADTHECFRSDRAPNEDKPERHRQVWTRGELVRLRELLGRGRTFVEVADELGRTEEAVHTRACAAGLVKTAND